MHICKYFSWRDGAYAQQELDRIRYEENVTYEDYHYEDIIEGNKLWVIKVCYIDTSKPEVETEDIIW